MRWESGPTDTGTSCTARHSAVLPCTSTQLRVLVYITTPHKNARTRDAQAAQKLYRDATMVVRQHDAWQHGSASGSCTSTQQTLVGASAVERLRGTYERDISHGALCQCTKRPHTTPMHECAKRRSLSTRAPPSNQASKALIGLPMCSVMEYAPHPPCNAAVL